MNSCIYQNEEDGKWYFYDESYDNHGPYPSIYAAHEALELYINYCLEGGLRWDDKHNYGSCYVTVHHEVLIHLLKQPHKVMIHIVTKEEEYTFTVSLYTSLLSPGFHGMMSVVLDDNLNIVKFVRDSDV